MADRQYVCFTRTGNNHYVSDYNTEFISVNRCVVHKKKINTKLIILIMTKKSSVKPLRKFLLGKSKRFQYFALASL